MLNYPHPNYARLLAAFCLLIWSSVAHAQNSDREEILDLIARAFAAVTSQNADEWRELQLAEGTTISFRASPDGDPAVLNRARIENNEESLAGLEPDGSEFMERWTAEPTVMIRGPIAVVWGEYDFWIDGEFSHCGVDAIDVVKLAGEWRVANWMWTVERADCPTAPDQ